MPEKPMLRASYPYYLAGQAVHANTDLPVLDKWSGVVATRVALADAVALEQAIAAAAAAAPAMQRLPPYARAAILTQAAQAFTQRREELAMALCIEAGKPIRDSRGEVDRLIATFSFAASEALRIGGEVLPLDVVPRAQGYRGMWQRVPVGPCSLISPFNFPLNLAAHKIAPAIAAGCPFVLKPASATPVGALLIAEVLATTELIPGAFSVLPCARENAGVLASDPRFKLLSFTGSPEVGWDLKARAGHKKVVLELGGNAAVIIDADCDLADAVARVVVGAFYQSGQSCISVQRILVHEAIYEPFVEQLVAATTQLVAGDPRDERTFIGPLISERDAIRLEGWIEHARRAGARVLVGGERCGALLAATLLTDVPRDEPIVSQEAFGPVAVISRWCDFGAALAEVNDSRYGLQAGLFTRDYYRMQRAWDELEVGAVIVGDVPSWRVDHMPYGGVKDSGLGREGLRWAIEDMTEMRLLVIRTPPSERR
jgi:acyl-CoA reductase-like NAD-dependent aldehyde dehydrogenase